MEMKKVRNRGIHKKKSAKVQKALRPINLLKGFQKRKSVFGELLCSYEICLIREYQKHGNGSMKQIETCSTENKPKGDTHH